jgi:integrase
MAHIEDRWFKTTRLAEGRVVRVKTERFGKGHRYRVRYVTPDGKERSKSFPDRAKRDAEAFLVSVESDKLRGVYVDPHAGRETFGQYAATWLDHQTFDESTREVTERRLRRHILPYLGGVELSALRPTHVRELDRKLQVAGLSPSFRSVVFANVSTVLNSAVDDERIARNPCHARTLRPPRVGPSKIVPLTRDQVHRLRDNMADRYAVAVDLGAGCGMRQGEILALAVDDIDFGRQVIHVVRQLKIVGNRLVFALPKGRKTRDVPLPSSVAARLRTHLDRLSPLSVVLPWDTPAGKPVGAELVVYGKTSVPIDRHTFNRYAWWPAATAAGIEKSRENGMHALRHFYASALLDGGESIKALAAYLGHSDPGFTLRTYTHLMPSSEERTRRAIDLVLGSVPPAPRPGDGPGGHPVDESAA